MVKPGMLPVAPPPAAAFAPAVPDVHVAQTKLSAWAGIDVTAQEANIRTDSGLVKVLIFMIELLIVEIGVLSAGVGAVFIYMGGARCQNNSA
jgi:hypothetical protein